jgi:hypothetical protein
VLAALDDHAYLLGLLVGQLRAVGLGGGQLPGALQPGHLLLGAGVGGRQQAAGQGGQQQGLHRALQEQG